MPGAMGELMSDIHPPRCEGCGYYALSTRYVDVHEAWICVVCYPHEDVDA